MFSIFLFCFRAASLIPIVKCSKLFLVIVIKVYQKNVPRVNVSKHFSDIRSEKKICVDLVSVIIRFAV